MISKSSSSPKAPEIKALDPVVVNRIAAGEVIHRPASALKELLENSIDAGATSITVTARDGGLKTLQIVDNGHGIRSEDLPIVCKRFTTSKLRQFDDLKSISTYGFRGEALASITHVAHVQITSKTKDQSCAYRARYIDGEIAPMHPGGEPRAEKVAGVVGTQILVEDLFYNVKTRRSALNRPSAEYKLILDVVSKYAIHSGGKGRGITCKKIGKSRGRSSTADVHTRPTSSVLDNIRSVYGRKLTQELIPFSVSLDETKASRSTEQEEASDSLESQQGISSKMKFEATGYISNANWNQRRFEFILFINHRLVDCSMLKRALSAVYSEYLPHGRNPFVYLSIEIAPHLVDVNVHPTKREVLFLHQELLVDTVSEALQDKLLGANKSRTFYTQAVFKPESIPASEKAGNTSLKMSEDLPGLAVVTDEEDKRQDPAAKGETSGIADPAKKSQKVEKPAEVVNLLSFSHQGRNSSNSRSDTNKSSNQSSRSSQRESRSSVSSNPSGYVQVETGMNVKKKKSSKTKGGNAHADAAYAHHLTRTDARANTMDMYLSRNELNGNPTQTRGGARAAVQAGSRGAGQKSKVSKAKFAKESHPGENNAMEEIEVYNSNGGKKQEAGQAQEEPMASERKRRLRDDAASMKSSKRKRTEPTLTQETCSALVDSVMSSNSTEAMAVEVDKILEERNEADLNALEKFLRAQLETNGNDGAAFASSETARRMTMRYVHGLINDGLTNLAKGRGDKDGAEPEDFISPSQLPPSPVRASQLSDDEEEEEGYGISASVQSSKPSSSGSSESSNQTTKPGGNTQAGYVVRKYPRTGFRDPDSDPGLLTSIQDLRNGLRFNVSSKIKALLKGHVFIGVVDSKCSLVQYNTTVHVVSHEVLVKEFFYQQVLFNIGSFFILNLERPLPVRDLFNAALTSSMSSDELKLAESGLDAILQDSNRRAMLEDYFAIHIDDNGNLCKVPDLLPGYLPLPAAMPILILELCSSVEWTREQQCFEDVAWALGRAYGMLPRLARQSRPLGPDGCTPESSQEDLERSQKEIDHLVELRHVLQNVVFPAFKSQSRFYPPADFIDDRAIVQVASLDNLYKVFERC